MGQKPKVSLRTITDSFTTAYFPGLFGGAKTPDEWEAEGWDWGPHVQVITNVKDDFHFSQVVECVKQHADGVVAFFITPTFNAEVLSIELQFGSPGQRSAFLKAYGLVRLRELRHEATNESRHARLLNERMYVLGDGREFWLYQKGEKGHRIGKVLGTAPGTFEDCAIPEEVLRRSRMVPAGEEPWRPF